jgi:hypothetical protein
MCISAHMAHSRLLVCTATRGADWARWDRHGFPDPDINETLPS